MRGMGKMQAIEGELNCQKIYWCIAEINENKRFITMNEIHRRLKINMNSLRKHIETMKKDGRVFEELGHNNSRCFSIWVFNKKLKSDLHLQFDFRYNTKKYIDHLKFQNIKPRKKIPRLKSGRNYNEKTERQERKEEKERLKKSSNIK